MARSFVFLLTFLVLAGIASTQVSSEVLFDETTEPRILVNPRDTNATEDTCEAWQYEWTNGTCIDCLDHEKVCERSRQCCTVENMSCWRYVNNSPKCLCDIDYVWVPETKECTYIPRVRYNIPLILVIVTSFILLLISVSLLAYLLRSCNRRRADDKMRLIKEAL